MVGQRVQQEASDQRAAADHQILGALQTINQMQLEILRRLEGNPTTSTKYGPDAA
jgi:hypothetical protein